ncbi:xanthine dehydrogenase family protein subunit M [Egibacter rhizosphaerae]|uniref:Xanthine dehydrogenase family protein subunit M n=1 Tax=Egibacter rhizosphaerae TaxID=1670831 RepID=A0A411YKQ9_9ACTN|nr:xanthine dehydrogenase family protein subunit M [Egibacter rhizosphaerae]QBI21777.1 xanthine dehydrogenase family protein subunit M [Egibacter rhizosphaerae]
MIPADFEYVRAQSVRDVVDALAQHGDEAKLLAGGHSLLPIMKLRLAIPEVVVDLERVDDLSGISDGGDHVAIGAMTRHETIVQHPGVREHCGLLAEATAQVGDPQVRHRGTIGGALAHGDAAGDLPAVAVAMGFELVAEGPTGRRTIPARDFFVDYLQTALSDDEVLVEVRVPKYDGWGHRYEKFNRVAQAWAIVGAAAMVRRENGAIAEARVGLTHMASVPLRAEAAEQALAGVPAEEDAVAAAAARADDGADPPSDVNAAPDYRRHLAHVLTRRAVLAAAGS